MTRKEHLTRELIEAAQEFPDPLIDEIDFKDFDPTGDEVDMEAYFGVDKLDTGEKRLMFAVAEEAVNNYMTTANSTDFFVRRAFNEVNKWFFSDDASWTFSFLNICRLLNMDEENLRDKLTNWRKKHAILSFATVKPATRNRQKKL